MKRRLLLGMAAAALLATVGAATTSAHPLSRHQMQANLETLEARVAKLEAQVAEGPEIESAFQVAHENEAATFSCREGLNIVGAPFLTHYIDPEAPNGVDVFDSHAGSLTVSGFGDAYGVVQPVCLQSHVPPGGTYEGY